LIRKVGIFIILVYVGITESGKVNLRSGNGPFGRIVWIGGKHWVSKTVYRCRANAAHRTKSRPDSGLNLQVKVLATFQAVRSSLGSGPFECERRASGVEPRGIWHMQDSPDQILASGKSPCNVIGCCPSARKRTCRMWTPRIGRRTPMNITHPRQSRPDSGLDFQVKVLKSC